MDVLYFVPFGVPINWLVAEMLGVFSFLRDPLLIGWGRGFTLDMFEKLNFATNWTAIFWYLLLNHWRSEGIFGWILFELVEPSKISQDKGKRNICWGIKTNEVLIFGRAVGVKSRNESQDLKQQRETWRKQNIFYWTELNHISEADVLKQTLKAVTFHLLFKGLSHIIWISVEGLFKHNEHTRTIDPGLKWIKMKWCQKGDHCRTCC